MRQAFRVVEFCNRSHPADATHKNSLAFRRVALTPESLDGFRYARLLVGFHRLANELQSRDVSQSSSSLANQLFKLFATLTTFDQLLRELLQVSSCV